MRLGNSPNKSTSTLTIAQFGCVWFFIAISTCNCFPIASSNKKIASLPKTIDGNSRKEIHAFFVVVCSSGSKSGSGTMLSLDTINSDA